MTEPEPLAELTGALLPEDREWLGQHGWKPAPEPGPELMTTGRAAARLGIHPDTLARWWAEGKVTPAAANARGQNCWSVAELLRQRDAIAPARKRKSRPKHRLGTRDLWWAFLAADLIVAIALIAMWWGLYDRTVERTPVEVYTPVAPGTSSAEIVCSTYASVLGSYDPAGRTLGADRDNYEHVFTQLRATYQQLGCH